MLNGLGRYAYPTRIAFAVIWLAAGAARLSQGDFGEAAVWFVGSAMWVLAAWLGRRWGR